MATFSKATFNTAKYAAARPTYPRQLFDFIFQYHERMAPGSARWDTAVDLGCGTGTLRLSLPSERTELRWPMPVCYLPVDRAIASCRPGDSRADAVQAHHRRRPEREDDR